MGGEVERQIQRAIEALTEVNPEKARTVITDDEAIDRMEVAIEEQAVSLLALQQPVAVDLRFLIAALKINSDLERIGDHAVNIAESAERLSLNKPLGSFRTFSTCGSRDVHAERFARRVRQPGRGNSLAT